MKDKTSDIKAIKISDYAYQIGYTKKLHGSTKIWLKLENPTTGDKVLINTTKNLYKNIHIDNDKGSIIDFASNRIDNIVKSNNQTTREDKAKAYKELGKLIGEIPEESKFSITPASSYNADIKQKIKQLKALDPYVIQFLNKHRKIAIDTLNLPNIKGTIMSASSKMKSGHIINNTAFVQRDLKDNKIKGYTTYFYSQKKKKTQAYVNANIKGAYITNYDDNTSRLLIGENEIDALSHLELKGKPTDVYITTGGQFNEKIKSDIIALYDKIENYKKRVSLINDNDQQGNLYDIQILKEFNNHKSNYIINTEQSSDKLRIEHFIAYQKNSVDLKDMEQKIRTILKQSNVPQQSLNLVNLAKLKDKTILEVPLFKQKDNIHKHLRVISSYLIHHSPVHISIEKSKSKDWNQDLQDLKNPLKKKTESPSPIQSKIRV